MDPWQLRNAAYRKGTRKMKRDKKNKQAKDDPNTQTKIILHLQNENKKLKEKLNTMTTLREGNNDDMENNRQEIRDLEAAIDVLVAHIKENDKKSKPTRKRNGEGKIRLIGKEQQDQMYKEMTSLKKK